MFSSSQPNLNNLSIGALKAVAVGMPTKTTGTQACDRCRSKKVKCSLGLPVCSRCCEDRVSCLYSFIKRKPGPAKGSRRKRAIAGPGLLTRRQSESNPFVSRAEPLVENQSPQEAYESLNTFPELFLTGLEHGPSQIDRGSSSQSHDHTLFDLQLPSDQERQILEKFFTNVQPSIPLLCRESFMQRYECGEVDQYLLRTLLAIVIKVQGIKDVWEVSSTEAYLRSRLDEQASDEQTTIAFTNLDRARESCLLAFYEFHQYPGQKAWLRIGRLARGAYIYGLHQIDNKDHGPLYGANVVREGEEEEWKQVWWWIYCLDSYCNITAATPFLIEVGSIRTALFSTRLLSNEQTAMTAQIFLPPETDSLWKTVKEIVSQDRIIELNLQLVSQTALRRAATLARLSRLNPSDRLYGQLAMLEDHVAALRLALPVRYLSPPRDVSSNESSVRHHARLVYLLELHACRLLIALCLLHKNEAEWIQNWQKSLETCEDIVLIIRHWDPEYCSSVDPAICFIILRTLILLHLHSKKLDSSELELTSRLSSYQDLLLLFLGHFAAFWNLPSFLINSFNKLCSLLPPKLNSNEIQQFLRHHQGLLHQSWFKMVSLKPESVHPQIQPDLEANLPSEWDLIDWTSWANIPRSQFD